MQAMGAGKGRSIVAADGTGQTMLFKESLKTAAHRLGAGVLYGPQFEHHATVLVTHREGFNALALGVMPPAFEVHSPDVIGRFCFESAGEAT